MLGKRYQEFHPVGKRYLLPGSVKQVCHAFVIQDPCADPGARIPDPENDNSHLFPRLFGQKWKTDQSPLVASQI